MQVLGLDLQLVAYFLEFLGNEEEAVKRVFGIPPFLLWSANVDVVYEFIGNLIVLRNLFAQQDQYILELIAYEFYFKADLNLSSESVHWIVNREPVVLQDPLTFV